MPHEIYIVCPHCLFPILIMKKDINCAIFRHGVYKYSGKQMDPHTKKRICDEVKRRGLIYGCGKPFQLKRNKRKYYAVPCGYI